MILKIKKLIISFFLLASFTVFSQSNIKHFFSLSTPIKSWVILHPFKAKKAYKISIETNKISDSIAKTSALDKDTSGGQVDAFRHAYWMIRLKQEIGKSAAKSLGKAHEKENFISFKKGNKEDGVLPDSISSEMDLYNNKIGLELIPKNRKISKKEIIQRILVEIKEGKFKILKKDTTGNFLKCSGERLSKKELFGKWKNAKCLVKSNYVY